MAIKRKFGATKRLKYTVKDEAGNTIDVTGWKLRLTISSDENPNNTDNELAQSNAILDNPTVGEVYFPMTGAPSTIPPGSYFYDIRVSDGNSELDTVEQDVWTVEQSIGKGPL